MRVFLDANILISYLLEASDESAIKQCVNAAFTGRYTLLLAQPLLDEFTQRVTTKPYLAQRITRDNVVRLQRIILSTAELVPRIIGDIPAMSRDPKDDYLIAYALAGRADYLVTGDKDVLVLGQVGAMQILTPSQFVALL